MRSGLRPALVAPVYPEPRRAPAGVSALTGLVCSPQTSSIRLNDTTGGQRMAQPGINRIGAPSDGNNEHGDGDILKCGRLGKRNNPVPLVNCQDSFHYKSQQPPRSDERECLLQGDF